MPHQRRRKIRGIQIRKEEVKLSLFAEDMILYIENPKDAARKLLVLFNEFDEINELIDRNHCQHQHRVYFHKDVW